MNKETRQKAPLIVCSPLLNVDPLKKADEDPNEGLAVTMNALRKYDSFCRLAYPTECVVNLGVIEHPEDIPAEAAEALSSMLILAKMNDCKIVDNYVVMNMTLDNPFDFTRIAKASGANLIQPHVVIAYISKDASANELKDVIDLIEAVNDALKYFPHIGLQPTIAALPTLTFKDVHGKSVVPT